jgi:Ets-domain
VYVICHRSSDFTELNLFLTGPYKAAHLWEFMLSLLLNPTYSGSGRIVQWEDMERGVFRINESQRVAELWGKHKQNNSMNYEKLSRALR